MLSPTLPMSRCSGSPVSLLGPKLIALYIGPETGWQQALADATAHEYHHAAWVRYAHT